MISAVFQGFRKNHSGSLAKKRLKVVLVTDKADCSPELIDRMKDDTKCGQGNPTRAQPNTNNYRQLRGIENSGNSLQQGTTQQ